MNNEFISQLGHQILSIIIALFLLANISMLFGYRFITKQLIKSGMKKGDPLREYRTPKKLSKLTPEVIHEQETNPKREQEVYSRVQKRGY